MTDIGLTFTHPSLSLTKYGNIQGCCEQFFDWVVEVLLSQLLPIGALCNEVGQELDVALLLLGALLEEGLCGGHEVTCQLVVTWQ